MKLFHRGKAEPDSTRFSIWHMTWAIGLVLLGLVQCSQGPGDSAPVAQATVASTPVSPSNPILKVSTGRAPLQ